MPAGSSISSGPDRAPSAVTAKRFTVPIGGTSLVCALHVPVSRAQAPVVVACHGLGASKDSDKYLLLGAALPAAGLALARFDFRGAGESGGSYRDATTASRLRALEAAVAPPPPPPARVGDLEAVLALLPRHQALSHRVGLLGSSMGGYVAWHVAHRRIQAG